MMDVELEAVVDEQTMRLSEVFDLKIGSRIMFHATPDSLVDLRCGNVSMYMGKKNGPQGQSDRYQDRREICENYQTIRRQFIGCEYAWFSIHPTTNRIIQ